MQLRGCTLLGSCLRLLVNGEPGPLHRLLRSLISLSSLRRLPHLGLLLLFVLNAQLIGRLMNFIVAAIQVEATDGVEQVSCHLVNHVVFLLLMPAFEFTFFSMARNV